MAKEPGFQTIDDNSIDYLLQPDLDRKPRSLARSVTSGRYRGTHQVGNEQVIVRSEEGRIEIKDENGVRIIIGKQEGGF